MFDVIGKRRWYFLFSLVLTVPGLLFILATPINNDIGAEILDRLHGRHALDDPVRRSESDR